MKKFESIFIMRNNFASESQREIACAPENVRDRETEYHNET